MLLYIHCPFCVAKCAYCAFYSIPAQAELWAVYEKALLAEMARWSDILQRPALSSIYFGGGTPSLMPEKLVERLFEQIRRLFRPAADCEITFEANPDSADSEAALRPWRKAGAGRLSLGVQSFDDAMLRRLGRVHDSAQAAKACRHALDLGFKLNIDLIWGLPGQSLKAWLGQLKLAVELQPQHISCYGLTLEAGAALTAALNPAELPPEKEQARMYVQGGDFLESEGFFQYEISNFSKMGFQCRHNIGYWQGLDYLGLGPAAVSTIGGLRRGNPKDFRQWAQSAGQDDRALTAERLSAGERLREHIMLALRTSQGLDLAACRRQHGLDLLARHRKLIAALQENGLAALRHNRLRLTRNGMVVSNAIIERLLP